MSYIIALIDDALCALIFHAAAFDRAIDCRCPRFSSMPRAATPLMLYFSMPAFIFADAFFAAYFRAAY